MEKKIEAREGSRRALTITIAADTIAAAYDKQLDDLVKNSTIKGFRKGKAPKSHIERLVGDGFYADVAFKCVDDQFAACVDELDMDDKPLAFSAPRIENEEELKPVKGEPFTVTVVYDAYPEVKLGAYTGLDIDYIDAKVGDADIDAEIEGLREQNSTITSCDGAAEEGMIANVDFAEVGEDGEKIASTAREGFTFTIGSNYDHFKVDSDLIGMKAGEEKTVEKTYGDDEEDSDLRGRTAKVWVKLNSLRKRELPELDDEFAQDVKEEYKTVQDMKDDIRRKLAESLDLQVKDHKDDQLIQAIVANAEMEIPESMVQFAARNDARDYLRQMGRSYEEAEMYLEREEEGSYFMQMMAQRAKEQLRVQLVIEAVQKLKLKTATDEEVEKAAGEKFTDNMSDEAKETVRKQARDHLDYLAAIDYLRENNNFKAAKTVGARDFQTEVYKMQAEKAAASAAEEDKEDK